MMLLSCAIVLVLVVRVVGVAALSSIENGFENAAVDLLLVGDHLGVLGAAAAALMFRSGGAALFVFRHSFKNICVDRKLCFLFNVLLFDGVIAPVENSLLSRFVGVCWCRSHAICCCCRTPCGLRFGLRYCCGVVDAALGSPLSAKNNSCRFMLLKEDKVFCKQKWRTFLAAMQRF